MSDISGSSQDPSQLPAGHLIKRSDGTIIPASADQRARQQDGTGEKLVRQIGVWGLQGKWDTYGRIAAASVLMFFVIKWDGRQDKEVEWMKEREKAQQVSHERQLEITQAASAKMEATVARLEGTVGQQVEQARKNNEAMVRAIVLQEAGNRRLELLDKDAKEQFQETKELNKQAKDILSKIREWDKPVAHFLRKAYQAAAGPEMAPMPHEPKDYSTQTTSGPP